MHLGKEGYKKTVTGLIKRKLSFENEVRKKFPEVEITDGGGISIGLVNKRPFPENFLSKYGFTTVQPRGLQQYNRGGYG